MKRQKKYKSALWTQLPAYQTSKVKTNMNQAATERRLYRKEASEFVKQQNRLGRTCDVVNTIPELRNGKRYGWPVSNKLTEVHHTRGRLGSLLRDQQWWMAVSKAGHRWIHSHPTEARKRGWLCEHGKWNQETTTTERPMAKL